jgi:hypothetical protein
VVELSPLSLTIIKMKPPLQETMMGLRQKQKKHLFFDIEKVEIFPINQKRGSCNWHLWGRY